MSSPSPPSPLQLRILISGASIAGPTLAYWLLRSRKCCDITVVERARILRTAGQGVDIRDSAREVIRRMGLFDRIRDASSHEEGFAIVDRENRALAKFGVGEGGESVTCDIEILRGELAGILVDVTTSGRKGGDGNGDGENEKGVKYVFGEEVEGLVERAEDDGGGVEVTFKNGTPAARFDLVVAADGIGSRIRRMMIGSGNGASSASTTSTSSAGGVDDPAIRSLLSYATYFSIPRDPAADTMWAQSRSSHGGRFMMLRPDNIGTTRAFLGLTAYEKSDPRLKQFARASKEGIDAQKALVSSLFRDADWTSIPRILDGMHSSEDLYMQHIAQVRLSRWSSPGGRITVVGDAGYSPSPFSGMGTSLAFIGAYILAGEISKCSRSEHIPAALASYEKILKPYVESIQKLPPGIPWIICPQTSLGVTVVESIARVVGWLNDTGIIGWLGKVVGWISIGSGTTEFKLPEYEAFEKLKE